MVLISSPTPIFPRNWRRWGISAGLKDKNGLAVTVQPSDEYQKQSSWGRRLLIAGGVCFLLGAILSYSQLYGLVDIVDPNKNNVANIGIGEQESVELTKSCYVAWSENMSKDIEFVVYDHHGVVVNQTGCGYEFEAMDESGSEFNRLGSWKLSDGTYDVHVICNSEVIGTCSEGDGMLLDYDEAFGEIFGDLAFWLSCLICMMGFVLLPIGGILHWMASRGQLKSQRTVMVVNEHTGDLQSYAVDGEGRLVVSQTPSANHPNASAGVKSSGMVSGQTDKTEIAPGEEMVVGAAGGTGSDEGLMTTDQIYLLMHGSEQDKVNVIENAFQDQKEAPHVDSGVPAPFVDSQFNDAGFTTSPFSIPDTKYSEQSDELKEKKGDGKSTPHRGVDEKEEVVQNDSWKDWDEG